MSRPLTGSKKLTDTGWTASLPIHRGATKRQTYTFTTEEATDRWIAAGIAAIESGTDLPVPDAEGRVAKGEGATSVFQHPARERISCRGLGHHPSADGEPNRLASILTSGMPSAGQCTAAWMQRLHPSLQRLAVEPEGAPADLDLAPRKRFGRASMFMICSFSVERRSKRL